MCPEVERLLRSWFDRYTEAYASRDESLLEQFSENFSGFAGGDDRITKNLPDWIKVTRSDFAQVPGPIDIEVKDLVVQGVSDDVVILTALARITLPIDGGVASQLTVRHVQVRRREGSGWKIVHSSTSVPTERDDGGVYPLQALQERTRALEALVEDRTRALEMANEKLTRLSETDELTGVANRRRFDEALGREWARARRSGASLALIMLDVDHFKAYNDKYGHVAGDDCLKTVASTMSRSGARRAGDVLARYGGEEFVALLPNTGEEEALRVAWNIHRELRAMVLPHEASPLRRVTASMGIVSLIPSSEVDPHELVQQADTALYRAKRSGRDRVVVAGW